MNALESSSNTCPAALLPTPPTDGDDEPPSTLRAALVDNKLRLLSALREAGVHCATISYFGEGDSGSIQHVDVSGADGSKPDVSRHCVTYLHCNGWFLFASGLVQPGRTAQPSSKCASLQRTPR